MDLLDALPQLVPYLLSDSTTITGVIDMDINRLARYDRP
jgi:hypothetical protein